jgi:allophanate hydrolase subunit 2
MPWTVAADSNRVALRLTGEALVRRREGELPSEGLVLGAVQVPPDGQPLVFLADHPTTGGYPVVGVVDAADLWQCAQLRPGEPVRFRAHH